MDPRPGARNTQFEQEFFGLFRAETVSAYDWRDRIGDFCVADYLAELDKVHVMRYSTRPERAFHLPLRRSRFSDQMVGTLRSEQLKGHRARSCHQLLCLVNANFATPVNRVVANAVSHFGTEGPLAH